MYNGDKGEFIKDLIAWGSWAGIIFLMFCFGG